MSGRQSAIFYPQSYNFHVPHRTAKAHEMADVSFNIDLGKSREVSGLPEFSIELICVLHSFEILIKLMFPRLTVDRCQIDFPFSKKINFQTKWVLYGLTASKKVLKRFFASGKNLLKILSAAVPFQITLQDIRNFPLGESLSGAFLRHFWQNWS